MPCWVSPPRPSSQRSLLAGMPASQRSRAPRPTRRCWPRTPRTPRSPPARPRSSTLDAILADLTTLQLSGGGGVVNVPAWAGFTTWELPADKPSDLSVTMNRLVESTPRPWHLTVQEDFLCLGKAHHLVQFSSGAFVAWNTCWHCGHPFSHINRPSAYFYFATAVGVFILCQ